MKTEAADLNIDELRRLRWVLRWPIGMALFIALSLCAYWHTHRLVILGLGVALWFCGYFQGRADEEIKAISKSQRKEQVHG